jgi:hypothetical protein
MFQRAQEIVKEFQDRVRTTLNVVADFAESIGVPKPVTSLLQSTDEPKPYVPPQTPAGVDPLHVRTATPSVGDLSSDVATNGVARPETKVNKKRGSAPAVDLSNRVRSLDVDDAINGSTYLARIIWCLGVADLEGNGALRPADIARMVMSRSPVSLEPPNVARYIRRSKPTCIIVDRTEGSSSFYRLNAKGKKIFDEKFGLN